MVTGIIWCVWSADDRIASSCLHPRSPLECSSSQSYRFSIAAYCRYTRSRDRRGLKVDWSPCCKGNPGRVSTEDWWYRSDDQVGFLGLSFKCQDKISKVLMRRSPVWYNWTKGWRDSMCIPRSQICKFCSFLRLNISIMVKYTRILSIQSSSHPGEGIFERWNEWNISPKRSKTLNGFKLVLSGSQIG